jgi:hypothetical protein
MIALATVCNVRSIVVAVARAKWLVKAAFEEKHFDGIHAWVLDIMHTLRSPCCVLTML